MGAAMSGIKIGWAEADITPEGEVELYGQYYRRMSSGIHSRIGATAMALADDSGEQAVMISVDLCNCGGDFLEDLRKSLAGKVRGLDPAKIVLNSTHTHNAPTVSYGSSWWEVSGTVEAYRKFVIEKLAGVVIAAWNARQPAGIASTSDFASVGHCRRAVYSNGTAEMYGDTARDDFMGMEGNEDSTVEQLFIFDAAQKPVGAIVNVACPSQVMEATYLVSSDYMGATRRLMKEKFGPDFHVLCQVSAAGCQSPRDLIRMRDEEFWSPRGVETIAKRVFAALLRGYDKIGGIIETAPEFAHSVKNVVLPKRKASYQDYLDAGKEIERLEQIRTEEKAFEDFCGEVKINEKIPGRPGPYDSKLHHFVLIKNAQAVLARHAEQQKEPDLAVELHFLRLGKAAIATNPFELYLDFGQQMKARSKAGQTFVVQLACGSGAYLPTARGEQLGGYGGLIINGVVGSDGGKLLVDETVRGINGMFN
jgi:hypothetical protein